MKKIFRNDFLVLVLWITPLGLVLSLLLGLHFAPYKVEPLRGLASEDQQLVAHHFLSLKCNCSKNLITHLLQRRAHAAVREIVHLLHQKSEVVSDLKRVGFEVQTTDEPSALKKFNLKALPQLVLMRATETIYQGGYGPDQQHEQVYEDEKIISSALQNERSASRPLLGCANGQVQKSNFDLLGVKYGYNF